MNYPAAIEMPVAGVCSDCIHEETARQKVNCFKLQPNMTGKIPIQNIRQVFIFILLNFIFAGALKAQQPSYGFSRDPLSGIEKMLNDKNLEVHTSVQPFLDGFDQKVIHHYDSLYKPVLQEKEFKLTPLFAGGGGFLFADSSESIFSGYAGLDMRWQHNHRWNINAGYTFHGASPPTYIAEMAATMRFLPGVGYAVRDDENVYHTHYTYGSLSYNDGRHFHFELGKGKHFWGDGYRSLILSDNASSYPYFKISTNVWKLRYTNLWMQLRDVSQGQMRQDARLKYAAMHALSFNPHKKFNWTIYEMVVWQDRDTMSRRTLDINYLNPVIFYRPVEYSVGSPDNVILATSIKYRISKKLQMYGQFVLDEFNLKQFSLHKQWWGNKLAGQFGLKFFDIVPGLSLQTEANIARPFIYTHGSSIQSWSHLNQPLAHPLGANFIEWVNTVRIDKGDWCFLEQFNWSGFGRDLDADGNGTIDNFGGNITRSYRDPFGGQYGHDMMQGLKTTLLFHQFMVSKKVGKSGMVEFFACQTLRYAKNELSTMRDHFISVGVRKTGLLSPVIDY